MYHELSIHSLSNDSNGTLQIFECEIILCIEADISYIVTYQFFIFNKRICVCVCVKKPITFVLYMHRGGDLYYTSILYPGPIHM